MHMFQNFFITIILYNRLQKIGSNSVKVFFFPIIILVIKLCWKEIINRRKSDIDKEMVFIHSRFFYISMVLVCMQQLSFSVLLKKSFWIVFKKKLLQSRSCIWMKCAVLSDTKLFLSNAKLEIYKIVNADFVSLGIAGSQRKLRNSRWKDALFPDFWFYLRKLEI